MARCRSSWDSGMGGQVLSRVAPGGGSCKLRAGEKRTGPGCPGPWGRDRKILEGVEAGSRHPLVLQPPQDAADQAEHLEAGLIAFQGVLEKVEGRERLTLDTEDAEAGHHLGDHSTHLSGTALLQPDAGEIERGESGLIAQAGVVEVLTGLLKGDLGGGQVTQPGGDFALEAMQLDDVYPYGVGGVEGPHPLKMTLGLDVFAELDAEQEDVVQSMEHQLGILRPVDHRKAAGQELEPLFGLAGITGVEALQQHDAADLMQVTEAAVNRVGEVEHVERLFEAPLVAEQRGVEVGDAGVEKRIAGPVSV